MLTLWSIFRSPLMIGANLKQSDAWTASLLTNPEVIAVDQHSQENHPAASTSTSVVWTAKDQSGDSLYVAVFNLDDRQQKVQYNWQDLGWKQPRYSLRDLWEHRDLGPFESLTLSLPPHGCALYQASK
jgi:hypothetical protein